MDASIAPRAPPGLAGDAGVDSQAMGEMPPRLGYLDDEPGERAGGDAPRGDDADPVRAGLGLEDDGGPAAASPATPPLPSGVFAAPGAGDATSLDLDTPARAPLGPQVVTPPPSPPTVSPPHIIATGLAALWDFVVALPVSLLPEPWRRRAGTHHLPLAAATTWSAIPLLPNGKEPCLDDGQVYGLGAMTFLSFLISPIGLATLFFFGEGVLRAFSAAVTREPCGSLPLFLLERGLAAARAGLGAARGRLHDGPLCADLLVRDPAGLLVIHTCRARPWGETTTLQIDGEHFRIDRYQETGPPRRHTYRLCRAPARHVIRQLVVYHPDDLLLEAARQRQARAAEREAARRERAERRAREREE